MKKIILILSLTLMITGLSFQSGQAYESISAEEAHTMISEDNTVVVVDVRGNIDYCYGGHIPCALNLDWNSGQFEREYQQLPLNAPIINICAHGNRGRYASAFLDRHGYSQVYNVSGGMSVWPYEKITCKNENPDDCIKQGDKYHLYFPHIASGDGWETEVAIINTSAETGLDGTLNAYDNTGKPVGEPRIVDLSKAGRMEIIIGETFSDPNLISHLIFTADSDQTYGYLKFYGSPDDSYRVAIPAPATVNHDNIIVSHIAVTKGWWTGLNLLNTTAKDKTLTITFNNNLKKDLTLKAGAQKALNLAEFVGKEQLEEINSAVISNADGIVGLEIFGNGKQLSGILLRDTTATTLYYPHIACDKLWWTGVIAFNTSTSRGTMTIKPYRKDGTPLTQTDDITIKPRERFVKAISELDLPDETHWLAIDSTVPLTGFELFGTTDSLQLGGYTCVGIDGESGVFPKLNKSGWSGIAFVNTTSNPITITLTAYSNDGTKVDRKRLPLNAFQKIVDQPETIFDNELDSATYITYKASAPVAAFQLNGDGEMLDALPGR